MTRAPKPPRVVWVSVQPNGHPFEVEKSRSRLRKYLHESDTFHRYVLADAPIPKRKRGRR